MCTQNMKERLIRAIKSKEYLLRIWKLVADAGLTIFCDLEQLISTSVILLLVGICTMVDIPLVDEGQYLYKFEEKTRI